MARHAHRCGGQAMSIRCLHPADQDAQHRLVHLLMRLETGKELLSRDDAGLDGQDRDIPGRALRPPVEHLELAEQVSGAKYGEHDLAAVRDVEGDLSQPRQHHEDRVAVIALDDDPGAALGRPSGHRGAAGPRDRLRPAGRERTADPRGPRRAPIQPNGADAPLGAPHLRLSFRDGDFMVAGWTSSDAHPSRGDQAHGPERTHPPENARARSLDAHHLRDPAHGTHCGRCAPERADPARPSRAGTGPAVYVLDGRVVAIRRDPLPAGAYGGHGVDYSPGMTALGSRGLLQRLSGLSRPPVEGAGRLRDRLHHGSHSGPRRRRAAAEPAEAAYSTRP